jgi:hypothetical protein
MLMLAVFIFSKKVGRCEIYIIANNEIMFLCEIFVNLSQKKMRAAKFIGPTNSEPKFN